MGTFIGAIVAVVLALAISAGLFVGANRLIDRIRSGWPIAVGGSV